MSTLRAKPLRIQYAGAVYHVMARGNHGQAIYGEPLDRKEFLETLGEACQKTGWRVRACVLMDNHYHQIQNHPGREEEHLKPQLLRLKQPLRKENTEASVQRL